MTCCCLSRSECVLIISIYCIATSVALLSVLGLHGHHFGPGFSPFLTGILHNIFLTVYSVSLATSLLLFLGLLLPLRYLLVPWLVSHLLLCVSLSCFSLYYLILYSSVSCEDSCSLLLVLSSCLVLAVVTLLYCIYVVQDIFDRLKYQEKVEVTEKIELEEIGDVDVRPKTVKWQGVQQTSL